MEGLTWKQARYVSLMAEGLPDRAMAARMGVSVNTVKTNIQNIFNKLNARSKAQAVAICLRRGLIK